MRIVHINTMTRGGAARAMLRLHEGLLAAGANSYFLTQDGIDGSCGEIKEARLGRIAKKLLPRLDRLPLRLFPRREAVEFNLQWVPGGILRALDVLKPDIVHLHWIGRGFVRIEDMIRIGCQIVWTMHDAWTFTGGCHYPYECTRYHKHCGCCPQLGSSFLYDPSWWLCSRKAKAWRKVTMTLVTPSRWLAECASSSPLLEDRDIRVIPNGLDLNIYKPFDRQLARKVLDLPSDKSLLLFGAVSALTDKRKGFHFLKPALEETTKRVETSNLELIVVGASVPRNPVDLGIPVRYMGMMHDSISLRLLYAAADVVVLPSLFESFGQMASESLACGTPVVAFNVTGFKDIVDHGENGYLASPYDAADLGRGIAEILTNPDKEGLRRAARAKAVREYGLPTMVERYMALYGEMLRVSRNDFGHNLAAKQGK